MVRRQKNQQSESGKHRERQLLHEEPPELQFDDIHGLAEQKRRLEQTLIATAENDWFGSYATSSAVIYGRTGTGRRRFVNATVGELTDRGYNFVRVNSLNWQRMTIPEFLASVLEQVTEYEPLVLLLDCFADFDRSAPFHEITEALRSYRTDGRQILLLANVPDSCLCSREVGEMFRAFDLSVELAEPQLDRRRQIIAAEFAQAREADLIRYDDSFDFQTLAVETEGFGVPELQTLVRRAVQQARTSNSSQSPPSVSTQRTLALIKQVDTERISTVRARASIENIESTAVDFDDVGGMTEVKDRIQEVFELPLVWDDAFEAFDLQSHGGILLHGPPGNGKTLLARAVANEVDRTFISIAAPNLKNKFGAGVENRLRSVFEKAERNAPSVVFFDEFDAIGHHRGEEEGKDQVTSTLLTELDGISRRGDIAVIAATNRLEVIDDALLRPGRFEFMFSVTPPGESEQREIFDIHTESLPLEESVTANWFVNRVDWEPSGADIAAVCEHALTRALDRTDNDADVDDVVVTRGDFNRAFDAFQRCRTATTQPGPLEGKQ